jgi:hypothetical protein
MWATWHYSIGGRLKSDIRFSPDLTYCTFPFPDLTPSQVTRIEVAARAVIASREAYPDSTLADLYDPLSMPPSLTAAHRLLDRAVDRTFTAKTGSLSTSVRLGILLDAYQLLANAGQLS